MNKNDIRCFLAVSLPDPLREKLGQLIEALSQEVAGVKWVPAKNIHLTLRFFGSVSEEIVENGLVPRIEEVASRYLSRLRLEGIDALILGCTHYPLLAEVIRKIVGSTYPGEADIGTIRGDFAHASKIYAKTNNQGHNLIHASENEQDAKEELALWFSKDEIVDYKLSAEEHFY